MLFTVSADVSRAWWRGLSGQSLVLLHARPRHLRSAGNEGQDGGRFFHRSPPEKTSTALPGCLTFFQLRPTTTRNSVSTILAHSAWRSGRRSSRAEAGWVLERSTDYFLTFSRHDASNKAGNGREQSPFPAPPSI